jgi:membrane-associated phospholipid phosphatase
LAVTAFGVCYARVLLGAHYVSDVLAGIAMALICFPVATLLTNKVLGTMTEKRLNFAINVWAVILLGLLIYLAVQ